MNTLVLEYHLRRRWENTKDKQQHMERYRSGHNEAVLKTVCPQGRVGSNPTLSASQVQKSWKTWKKYLTNKRKVRYNAHGFSKEKLNPDKEHESARWLFAKYK